MLSVFARLKKKRWGSWDAVICFINLAWMLGQPTSMPRVPSAGIQSLRLGWSLSLERRCSSLISVPSVPLLSVINGGYVKSHAWCMIKNYIYAFISYFKVFAILWCSFWYQNFHWNNSFHLQSNHFLLFLSQNFDKKRITEYYEK